jgi:hypothetical protein
MSPCPVATVPSGFASSGVPTACGSSAEPTRMLRFSTLRLPTERRIPGSANTRRFDMTLTAVAIRHVAFEDLGAFERAFMEFGLVFRYFDVGVDDMSWLDPGADEIAVTLGGPIGACDDRTYPFLPQEIAYVER